MNTKIKGKMPLMLLCMSLFHFATINTSLARTTARPEELLTLELNVSPNFRVLAERDDLHFPLDLSKLQNGDVQYGMTFSQAADFRDQAFLVLDRHQLKEKDDYAMFIVSKTAYMLKGKSPDFFNSKLFNSTHYIESTFTDTTAKETGTPNRVKIIRDVNVGPFNIGKINFELFIEEMNQAADADFIQKTMDFDAELGKPEVLSALYMTNADKMLNGTYVINKYYRVKNSDTLVVSYQFSSVKKVPAVPFFMIRNQAVKSAFAETRTFVKTMRAYTLPQ